MPALPAVGVWRARIVAREWSRDAKWENYPATFADKIAIIAHIFRLEVMEISDCSLILECASSFVPIVLSVEKLRDVIDMIELDDGRKGWRWNKRCLANSTEMKRDPSKYDGGRAYEAEKGLLEPLPNPCQELISNLRMNCRWKRDSCYPRYYTMNADACKKGYILIAPRSTSLEAEY
jgi:hypothetical protein